MKNEDVKRVQFTDLDFTGEPTGKALYSAKHYLDQVIRLLDILSNLDAWLPDPVLNRLYTINVLYVREYLKRPDFRQYRQDEPWMPGTLFEIAEGIQAGILDDLVPQMRRFYAVLDKDSIRIGTPPLTDQEQQVFELDAGILTDYLKHYVRAVKLRLRPLPRVFFDEQSGLGQSEKKKFTLQVDGAPHKVWSLLYRDVARIHREDELAKLIGHMGTGLRDRLNDIAKELRRKTGIDKEHLIYAQGSMALFVVPVDYPPT